MFYFEWTVATSLLALRWISDSPRTGCARRTKLMHTWREQAIIEWRWHVNSFDVCCHSSKLCALNTRAFRSQQHPFKFLRFRFCPELRLLYEPTSKFTRTCSFSFYSVYFKPVFVYTKHVLFHQLSGTFGWARTTKAGRLGLIPGRVITKTWRTALVARPISCLALRSECKKKTVDGDAADALPLRHCEKQSRDPES